MPSKQAEKIKSCKMKDKWCVLNNEWWRFQAGWGFWLITYDRLTDEQTFAIVELRMGE